jgi:hypothetical protein
LEGRRSAQADRDNLKQLEDMAKKLPKPKKPGK